MKCKILIILFVSILFQLAEAENLNLQAFGEAAILNKNITEARSNAVDNAIDNIITLALEKFISNSVISDNKQLLQNNIYARKLGYINRLELIKSEPKPGSPDILNVEIFAQVDRDLLESDLVPLNLLNATDNMPRVMILIQEKNIDDVHWHYQAKTINNAETILGKALIIKGFKLVNQDSLVAQITGEAEKDYYDNNVNNLIELCRLFGADIALSGKAISRPVVTLESEGGDTASAIANVTLTAFRAGSGLEIGSSSTSASASGLNIKEAGAIAITKASEEAILNIIPKINIQWEESQTKLFPFTMYVSGLKSIEALVQFKNELLNSLTGIKKFERRTFSGGAAAYDVEATINVQAIVDEINEKGLKSFTVKIRSHSENSLDLNVIMK